MKLFLGISDMPIYNFDKVLKSNNMAYMVVGWNERKDLKKLPINTMIKWRKIYNEYCEKTANNESLSFYSLSCEIGYLEMRYTVIGNLIYGLTEHNKKDFGKELNAWGIPFNIDGKIQPQFKVLERQLRIAKQNLGIKTRKLESLKESNNDQEGDSLIKQVIIIQEQLGVKVEVKKDSVEYFLSALDRLKEKLQQQKRVRNG